jgi:hypothetical protein
MNLLILDDFCYIFRPVKAIIRQILLHAAELLLRAWVRVRIYIQSYVMSNKYCLIHSRIKFCTFVLLPFAFPFLYFPRPRAPYMSHSPVPLFCNLTNNSDSLFCSVFSSWWSVYQSGTRRTLAQSHVSLTVTLR